METRVADLKRRLAQSAEAVCRRYLSNGRREGRYWLVGDLANTKGRSLYVRLRGPTSGRGAAGLWTDAATGEYGDLLDLIAASLGRAEFRDVIAEARRFLSLPDIDLVTTAAPANKAPPGSGHAARRLFAASRPVAGTLVERYLQTRGIDCVRRLTALRFHPRCFYRTERDEAPARETWPAMVASVTDLRGRITGVHRTWLDVNGHAKAPVVAPRRAMGDLLGHAVRFGTAEPAPAKAGVMAVGEGIETVLSLQAVTRDLPLAAALSAAHLAALQLPPTLRRLYLMQDNDPAGRHAVQTLAERAEAVGVQAIPLVPQLNDLNEDLRKLGPEAVAATVRVQLTPEDVDRFWRAPEA